MEYLVCITLPIHEIFTQNIENRMRKFSGYCTYLVFIQKVLSEVMRIKMFLPTELERTSVNSMETDSNLFVCWNALQRHWFRILFMPLRFFDVGKNLNVIHMRTFWYKISLTAKEEWEKLWYRHEKLSRSRLGEGHIGNKWKEKRGALQSLPKD